MLLLRCCCCCWPPLLLRLLPPPPGHRSIYCSCDSDCDAAAALIRVGPFGLEELFMDQGVDLFLNGHEVFGTMDAWSTHELALAV